MVREWGGWEASGSSSNTYTPRRVVKASRWSEDQEGEALGGTWGVESR